MATSSCGTLLRSWRAVRTAVAGLVVTASLQTVNADDTLMCRNSLVSVGMVAEEVVAKCGVPKDKTATDIPVRVRRPNGTVAVAGTTHVERWTYDRGYGRFPARLTFEDGKLETIELLTRP